MSCRHEGGKKMGEDMLILRVMHVAACARALGGGGVSFSCHIKGPGRVHGLVYILRGSAPSILL